MISLSINMSLVDNDRLFKGKKGDYLDAVLIETPNNQYGDDYMIVQSISKEERDAGLKGVILGNAKVIKPKPKEEYPDELLDNGDQSHDPAF